MKTTPFFPHNPFLDFLTSIGIALLIGYLLTKLISNNFTPKKKKSILLISILLPIALYFINVFLIVLLNFSLVVGGVGCLIIGVFMYNQLMKGASDARIKIESHHENGITKERGFMIGGKKVGSWEYYDEDGILIKEENHDDAE